MWTECKQNSRWIKTPRPISLVSTDKVVETERNWVLRFVLSGSLHCVFLSLTGCVTLSKG